MNSLPTVLAAASSWNDFARDSVSVAIVESIVMGTPGALVSMATELSMEMAFSREDMADAMVGSARTARSTISGGEDRGAVDTIDDNEGGKM